MTVYLFLWERMLY